MKSINHCKLTQVREFVDSIECTDIRKIEELMKADNFHVNATDNEGFPLLSIASQFWHNECLKVLLDTQNVNVNTQKSDGYTPLSISVINDEPNSLQTLLAHKAIDVSLKDKNGIPL